jgi:hypothetical protein
MSKDAFGPLVRRLEPVLDESLRRLAQARFRTDPIGGPKFSRATSIMSSAYKRHGQILGHALMERLRDCARLEVWGEDAFKLSHASDAELRKNLPIHAYRAIDLDYGDAERSIPVDVIVHDRANGTLRSYNVKRGNGAYDAAKRRVIRGELLRTQMGLRGYGAAVGARADTAEAYVIFYYGLRSIPKPFSLIREELDAHFQFPVVGALEAVNDLYRARLEALVDRG